MRVDLWPHAWAPRPGEFDFSADVASLGGGVMHARCIHTPAHVLRSPELMHDGANDLFLTTTRGRGCVIRTPDGESMLPAGGIALLSKARMHEVVTPWGGASMAVQVTHAGLARLLPGLEEAPVRIFQPGEPGTPGAALALGYAGLLARGGLEASALAGAVEHLHALVAGAIDARWAAGLPPGREADVAPRLALIQHDIRAHLDWSGLSLTAIARRHHLTPRQVQRLFARQGTSFTDFLSAARLERARALLADPRHRHRRVLEIALECGFDNVTAFNRAFRRRWGMTPSEARG